MKKLVSGAIGLSLTLVSLASNAAPTELQNYVTQCQNELGFTAAQVPAFNCNDAYRFAVGVATSPINDFFNYKKINDNVDLTFVCRWRNFAVDPGSGLSLMAASVELLIHNRQSGSTCFFSAKEDPNATTQQRIPTAIVSPTNFPSADGYWRSPSDLNSKTLASDGNIPVADIISGGEMGFPNGSSKHEPLQCVGCHVEGPYLASPHIAPFLARFGLLNDGHDTIANMVAPIGTPGPHYHAVGSGRYNSPTVGAFGTWDSIIYSHIYTVNGQPPPPACSGACHALGSQLPLGNLFLEGNAVPLLPSLFFDIGAVQTAPALMPPVDDASDYHFINRDNPGADATEIETFTASSNFPVLPYYCGVPTNLEAHAVGQDFNFSTSELAQIPDKLRSFNLRDGLSCFNADQPAGKKCADYAVSYECADGTWLQFLNNDLTTTDDGDHEERSSINAYLVYACGGVAPVGIQAQFTASNGALRQVKGPNDKLAQLTPTGLVCKNSDQTGGQACSSYVVRYRGCQPRSQAYLVKLQSQWVSLPTFNNRFVTTTNLTNDAETRGQAGNPSYSSQDWVVEAISGSSYVRLRDMWSNRYLTATSNNDLATVVVHNSDAALTRQQWAIEAVSGSTTEKRLRNVGSNRYLTVGNYTTDPYYAPIISQALSPQNWASQRWLIQ